jgi:hypothetical protein
MGGGGGQTIIKIFQVPLVLLDIYSYIGIPQLQHLLKIPHLNPSFC